jgi:hypothetical protein
MADPARGRTAAALEELLLRHGTITPEQVAQAKEEVKKWGGDLGRAFVDLGFISEELLMRAYARTLNVPYVDPATQPLDAKQVLTLGVQICERFEVIAVEADAQKRTARVATSDPTNANALRELAALTGFRLELACATAASIARAIRIYFYGEGTPVKHEDAAEPDAVEGIALEEAVPPPPAPPPGPGTQVAQLAQRVLRLEQYVGGLKAEINAELTANPQLAGLAARLEFLEQVASNDVGQLRALLELLVETGVVSREALAAKLNLRR